MSVAIKTSSASFEAQTSAAESQRRTAKAAELSSEKQEGVAGHQVNPHSRMVVDSVDAAMALVNRYRAELGTSERQASEMASDAQAAKNNGAAANDRVQDAAAAQEIARLVGEQLSAAPKRGLVAQANIQPRIALALLEG